MTSWKRQAKVAAAMLGIAAATVSCQTTVKSTSSNGTVTEARIPFPNSVALPDGTTAGPSEQALKESREAVVTLGTKLGGDVVKHVVDKAAEAGKPQ